MSYILKNNMKNFYNIRKIRLIDNYVCQVTKKLIANIVMSPHAKIYSSRDVTMPLWYEI